MGDPRRPGAPQLHEVGDGVFAYVQPDGSWGWSNAGLVNADGTAMLVDTLFDLDLTRDLLATLAAPLAGRPIDVVVNTHANGDHTYGNELLGDIRIVASEATAREMDELSPAMLHSLKQMDLGPEGNRFVEEAFGPFRFDDIALAAPNETFRGTYVIELGAHRVVLEDVGPAHTGGDVIVHVPAAGVVFTGDIFFHGGTPIVWAGPVSNWLAACRRIRELEPLVVVPGHGPVSDVEGIGAMEAYFTWLLAEVRERAGSGMSALDIAFDLDLGPFADWSDQERLVINVDAALVELVPGHVRMDPVTAFQGMGRYHFASR